MGNRYKSAVQPRAVQNLGYSLAMVGLLAFLPSGCGPLGPPGLPGQRLRPDLAAVRITLSGKVADGNYKLCFDKATDGLEIQNLGPIDVGPYNLIFGLAEQQSRALIHACKLAVTSRTRAGTTTKINTPGLCCPTSLDSIYRDRKYEAFCEVDHDHELDDADRSNNLATSQPRIISEGRAQLAGTLQFKGELDREVESLGTWQDNSAD